MLYFFNQYCRCILFIVILKWAESKTGHCAVCCKSKNIEEVRIEDEIQFLGEIKTNMDTNATWIRNISINNGQQKISVPFKIYTGASVSVMENIPNLPKLMKSNKVFVGPGKTILEIIGYCIAKMRYTEREIEE